MAKLGREHNRFGKSTGKSCNISISSIFGNTFNVIGLIIINLLLFILFISDGFSYKDSSCVVIDVLKFCDRRPHALQALITVMTFNLSGLAILHKYYSRQIREKNRVYNLFILLKSSIEYHIEDIWTKMYKCTNDVNSLREKDLKLWYNNQKNVVSKRYEEIDELESLIFENGRIDDDTFFKNTIDVINDMREAFIIINTIYDHIFCNTNFYQIDKNGIIKIIHEYIYRVSDKQGSNINYQGIDYDEYLNLYISNGIEPFKKINDYKKEIKKILYIQSSKKTCNNDSQTSKKNTVNRRPSVKLEIYDCNKLHLKIK